MVEEKVYLRSERTGIEYPLNGFLPPMDDEDPSIHPMFGIAASPSSPSLPTLVDLRELMTPVEHQLSLLSWFVFSLLHGKKHVSSSSSSLSFSVANAVAGLSPRR